MRVGLTIYGSLGERSGGFHYDRQLVEALRRAGDSVELVELPWRWYPRGLVDALSPAIRRRLDVDVDVMLQDELAHPSLLGHNRRLPYPIVSIVHHLRASEPSRLSSLYRTIERRYLSTVDGVVCNSGVTRDVVTDLGVGPERTVVAPPAGDRFDPAIDDETIAERGRRRPLRVVFVGNLQPRKGLDTLVEAIASVECGDEPPVELTVVGRPVDSRYVERVERAIDRHGLVDRVTLVGELSDRALAETLREHHVLAVPSRYEGFGIVYLEAMSFGLPVIASRAGGAREVVADGETGVLVDPDDPAAVADAIERLSTDRDRLVSMGTAARRRYESHPGWTETAGRVRRLLTSVVDAA